MHIASRSLLLKSGRNQDGQRRIDKYEIKIQVSTSHAFGPSSFQNEAIYPHQSKVLDAPMIVLCLIQIWCSYVHSLLGSRFGISSSLKNWR